MNGENAFGWVKVALVLTVVAIVGYALYKISGWIKKAYNELIASLKKVGNFASDTVGKAVDVAKVPGEVVGGTIFDITNPDAGLAPGEWIDENGIIRTGPKPPPQSNTTPYAF